uniref:Uncharacterized protein n=1 Tax=Haptolina brevifila TaxID=156173 RepID=A0A7S2JFS5_9EUKA
MAEPEVSPSEVPIDDMVGDGEGNEDAEVAELKEMIKRPPNSPPRNKKNKSKGPKKPLPEWDSTPHRPHPPALRGLKTDREPWAKDAKTYSDGMQGHGAVRRRGATVRQPRREEIEREYREGYEKWMKEAGWNSTPFRNAPWQIRGLNPVTREPWFEDMAIYNAKFGPKEEEEDGMYIDGTFGASVAITQTEQEKNWDSSIMKYVPYSLRGLKPVTNEPWARDEAVYRRADGMDEIADEYVAADHFLNPAVSDAHAGKWDASAEPPKGALRAYPK